MPQRDLNTEAETHARAHLQHRAQRQDRSEASEASKGLEAMGGSRSSDQLVLGCPEHNGADERRSGRLQVFDRVPAAPGSVAYAARDSIELPRNPAIHADGFEER